MGQGGSFCSFLYLLTSALIQKQPDPRQPAEINVAESTSIGCRERRTMRMETDTEVWPLWRGTKIQEDEDSSPWELLTRTINWYDALLAAPCLFCHHTCLALPQCITCHTQEAACVTCSTHATGWPFLLLIKDWQGFVAGGQNDPSWVWGRQALGRSHLGHFSLPPRCSTVQEDYPSVLPSPVWA